MKKFTIALSVILGFGFTTVCNANLWDRGGGLIYDDVLNITWLKDANYVNSTGYDDALYGWNTGGKLT